MIQFWKVTKRFIQNDPPKTHHKGITDFNPKPVTHSEVTYTYTYVPCFKCSSVNKVTVEKVSKGPKCGKCDSRLPFQNSTWTVPITSSGASKLINKSPLPVFVNASSRNCSACRQFTPVFNLVANETVGKAIFTEIQIEDNVQFAQMYGISASPTTLIFRNGTLQQMIPGALDILNFKSLVRQFVS